MGPPAGTARGRSAERVNRSVQLNCDLQQNRCAEAGTERRGAQVRERERERERERGGGGGVGEEAGSGRGRA